MTPRPTPEPPPLGRSPRRPLTVRRMMGQIVVIACVLGVLAWLARAVLRAREEARCAACVGHLKQLSLAMHNYAADFGGHLPPAVTLGPDGRPWHSWRVLILPYLEQSALYRSYRLDEPWDGPTNRTLHGYRIQTFSCPSHPDFAERSRASYVAVTGPATIFPGPDLSTRLDDVPDGLSHTILVVESFTLEPHWMEPRDLDLSTLSPRINDPARPSLSGHPDLGRANAALADTSSHVLESSTPPAVVRALLTIGGGEEIEAPD